MVFFKYQESKKGKQSDVRHFVLWFPTVAEIMTTCIMGPLPFLVFL